MGFTVSRSLVAVVALWVAALAVAQSSDPPRKSREFLGPRFEENSRSPQHRRGRRTRSSASTADTVRFWNGIAIDASGLDHTPVRAGESRVFGEQLGPGRSSRAMAIVHIAMFEAINAVTPRYRSYIGLRGAERGASAEAAIAQAAHDTLVAMFPSQRASFDEKLAADLGRLGNPAEPAYRAGIDLGKKAAAGILALRRYDNSGKPDPLVGTQWITSDEPGHWRQDPISRAPIALGAEWEHVKPFAMHSASQFRAAAPPSMTSPEYTRAYNEVVALGGDGATTPTRRTPEQTRIGIFWAYDGTPSLCAPPRLYNQLAVEISKQMGDAVELARLLALVNVAMADAGIAIWESKYYYDVWRPVTGVREADRDTGPTGEGDQNPRTKGDPNFWPLGAPASNLTGPNFTPPFPAYPSGHAGFGAALFQVLRRYYGRDDIAFTFVSDEFNGETVANDGTVRPLWPRRFASFSQAEEENGQSRIYLGIHWSFDKTGGIEQGRRVANYVFDNVYRPLHPQTRTDSFRTTLAPSAEHRR